MTALGYKDNMKRWELGGITVVEFMGKYELYTVTDGLELFRRYIERRELHRLLDAAKKSE